MTGSDEQQDREALTPGSLLALILRDRKMTQAQLAWVLGRPAQVVSEVITGRKRVTAVTARQLEAALGVSARVWLFLQAEHDLVSS